MIYEMLEEGETNARTAIELSKVLNCRVRSISLLVEQERRQGYPICATCNSNTPGYFKPADKATMKRYCDGLLHRMGEIAKTRRACLKSMDKLPDKK